MDSCNVEGVEPLLPEMWISKMETVARSLKDDNLDKVAFARLLRLVYHLCMLAPEALRIKGLGRDCEACLEALLDARHFDSAVILLLGSSPTLEIQRSDGGAKASVCLFPGEANGKARGQSIAQAVLAAIVECLTIEHALNQAVQSYPLGGDSPRKFQPGSRQ